MGKYLSISLLHSCRPDHAAPVMAAKVEVIRSQEECCFITADSHWLMKFNSNPNFQILPQEPFTNQKFKGTFDAWMKGTGPAHLFIYYQRPYKITDSGEIDEYRGGREEFFVTDGKCGLS